MNDELKEKLNMPMLTYLSQNKPNYDHWPIWGSYTLLAVLVIGIAALAIIIYTTRKW